MGFNSGYSKTWWTFELLIEVQVLLKEKKYFHFHDVIVKLFVRAIYEYSTLMNILQYSSCPLLSFESWQFRFTEFLCLALRIKWFIPCLSWVHSCTLNSEKHNLRFLERGIRKIHKNFLAKRIRKIEVKITKEI